MGSVWLNGGGEWGGGGGGCGQADMKEVKE